MDEMSSRISRLRSLLPSLEHALDSFSSSSAAFRIIRTVKASDGPNQAIAISEPHLGERPRTLFILDSSFNPPSRAHFALASSILSTTSTPSPHRLLLLFSTQNADKSPSPASFVQRLAMMIAFAEDLQLHVQKSKGSLPVDIGLATAPYFVDKSTSIATADPSPFPSSPTHVNLLGYDTLIRILAPKYYSKFTPPLSALEPFFGHGHRLMVLLRPNSSSDNAVTGETEEEQRAYIKSLADGSLEEQGLKREWASLVGVLEGENIKNAAGVSSTVIRRAAETRDWDEVRRTCTPGVAAWIEDQELYKEEG